MNCPICRSKLYQTLLVDVNKTCEDYKNKNIKNSNTTYVEYAVCDNCGFCFSPEMYKWTTEDFSNLIYNEDYIKVDPEYIKIRPENNAKALQNNLGKYKEEIRHLDYGGGNGLLSEVLRKEGWDSTSYDPYVNTNTNTKHLGKFNLITVFEVFEHVPSVDYLMEQISGLLDKKGICLFTTLLSDGEDLNKWWYLAPRNGHISLFSHKSLEILRGNYGFYGQSMSKGFHSLYKELPNFWKAQ